jgi:hypothetical protein
VIEAGVVVAYLSAYALSSGRRIADRSLQSLLDRLADRVSAKLGRTVVEKLGRDPQGAGTRADAAKTIDHAICADAAFADDLAELLNKLDQHGGREFINRVDADFNVQVFGSGSAIAARRDLYYAPPRRDPKDISDRPIWIKLLFGCAVFLIVGAAAVFGLSLVINSSDPTPGPPHGMVAAVILFVAGMIVGALAEVGNMITRRPPPRL